MKHIIVLFIISFGLFLGSCNNVEQEKQRKAQSDSLMQVQQDSLLDVFRIELEQIAKSIEEVATRNGVIQLDTSEGQVLSKESILAQVTTLDDLLLENQKKLDEVYKRMSSNKLKSKELEKLVKSMQNRISEREVQIDELMAMLKDKDLEIAEIKERVDSMRINSIELTEDLIQMDEELHLVYYIVGESKELKEKGVITKEGGVLGLGASKKLDVSQLDQDLFESNDQRDLERVPLYSKKATVITGHPESSYEFSFDDEGKVEELLIMDRKAFWSATDYLVVEVSN